MNCFIGIARLCQSAAGTRFVSIAERTVMFNRFSAVNFAV